MNRREKQLQEEMTKPWRTSSRTAANEACVEAGGTEGAVLVRDTKYAYREGETSPVLEFDRTGFRRFLGRLKSGELDL